MSKVMPLRFMKGPTKELRSPSPVRGRRNAVQFDDSAQEMLARVISRALAGKGGLARRGSSRATKFSFAKVVEMAMEAEARRCTPAAACCPFYMCTRRASRQRLRAFLMHSYWLGLTLTLTGFTLMASDVLRAFFDKGADVWFEVVSLLALVTLLVDLALQSTVDRSFVYSFFWTVELAAALSICMDLPNLLGFSSPGSETASLAVSMGENGRRVLRLTKLFGLLKVVRFRMPRCLNRKPAAGPPAAVPRSPLDMWARQEDSPSHTEPAASSDVRRRTLLSIRHLVTTAAMLIVLTLPLLQYQVPNRDLLHGLQTLELGVSQPYVDLFVHQSPPVLYLEVGGSVIAEDTSRRDRLRTSEVQSVATTAGSRVDVDVSSHTRRESLVNVLRTNLIIALLVFQAVRLQHKVDALLLEPVQRISEYLRPARGMAVARLSAQGQSKAWQSTESLSTKLMLASIECLRGNLNPAASVEWTRSRTKQGLLKKASSLGSMRVAAQHAMASPPAVSKPGKTLVSKPLHSVASFTSESTDARSVYNVSLRNLSQLGVSQRWASGRSFMTTDSASSSAYGARSLMGAEFGASGRLRAPWRSAARIVEEASASPSSGSSTSSGSVGETPADASVAAAFAESKPTAVDALTAVVMAKVVGDRQFRRRSLGMDPVAAESWPVRKPRVVYKEAAPGMQTRVRRKRKVALSTSEAPGVVALPLPEPPAMPPLE